MRSITNVFAGALRVIAARADDPVPRRGRRIAQGFLWGRPSVVSDGRAGDEAAKLLAIDLPQAGHAGIGGLRGGRPRVLA